MPLEGLENALLSPHQRAREKRDLAIIWLHRWGYATPTILGLFLSLDRSAGLRLAAALIKEGFAREVASPSNFGYQRRSSGRLIGPFLLMLTDAGKARAHGLTNENGAPNPRQITNQQVIRHNLLTAYKVAGLMSIGKISDYMPEAATGVASEAFYKQPDCILTLSNGFTQALEIELNGKFKRDLDHALQSILHALGSGRFSTCLYLFPSQAMADRYKEAWQKGRIPHWEKIRSKWHKTQDFHQIPNDLMGRVMFYQDDALMRITL